VKLGFAPAPPLRWTLAAKADVAENAETIRIAAVAMDSRFRNERIALLLQYFPAFAQRWKCLGHHMAFLTPG
jgi:hypothetical protein